MDKKNENSNKIDKDPQVKMFIVGSVGLLTVGLLFFIFGMFSVMSGSPAPENIQESNFKSGVVVEKNPQANQGTDPNMFVSRAIQRQKVDYPTVSFINPKIGSSDAPVTIIEFADFNCSYCAEVAPVIREVVDKYKDKVQFVWKNLPIVQLHPSAVVAAQSALCAGEQDKFWEYHDLLFENQQYFSGEMLLGFATQLNLNVDNFSNCVSSEKMLPRIEKSIQEAEDLNINGTPHFYINQQEISGAASKEDLERIIEIELTR